MPNIDEINSSLADLQEELQFLSSANEFIKNSKETAEKLISEVKLVHGKFKKESEGVIAESKNLNKSSLELNNSVSKLEQQISGIDFPNRLNRIDTSIVTLNNLISNMQNKIETVEKNISKEIDRTKVDLVNRIDKTDEKLNFVRSEIESKFASLDKENKILKYLMFGALILILTAIYFIIFGI